LKDQRRRIKTEGVVEGSVEFMKMVSSQLDARINFPLLT